MPSGDPVAITPDLQSKIAELEHTLLDRNEEIEELRNAVDQWQGYAKGLEEGKAALLRKNLEYEQHINGLLAQLTSIREKYDSEAQGRAPHTVVQSSSVSLRDLQLQVEKEMAHVQVDLTELRQQLGKRDDVIQALRDDLRKAKERIHWFETDVTLHHQRDRSSMGAHLIQGTPHHGNYRPSYLMSPGL